MDRLRFNVEKETLTQNLPEGTFSFNDMDSDDPYLEIIVTTVTDNQYLLHIELDGFPQTRPDVYIQAVCPYNASSWIEADLDDYQGHSLKELSAANHTLSPHPEHNWIQICHYNPAAWRPDISLWIVFLKCSFWLNAYEYSIFKKIPLNEVMEHQDEADVY